MCFSAAGLQAKRFLRSPAYVESWDNGRDGALALDATIDTFEMVAPNSGSVGEVEVVVSNRLPVVGVKGPNNRVTFKPGAGGLVTAMEKVSKDSWVGYPGDVKDPQALQQLRVAAKEVGCHPIPVVLGDEENDRYYGIVSNDFLWPLFHMMTDQIDSGGRDDEQAWETYRDVNRKFAKAAASAARGDGDRIWIHDYHLLLAGRMLAEKHGIANAGFFLHTPFPPVDVLLTSACVRERAQEIVEALLHFQVLGFQTYSRDVENFLAWVKELVPEAKIERSGDDEHLFCVRFSGNVTWLRDFPISIDHAQLVQRARSKECEAATKRVRHELFGNDPPEDGKVIFSAGRLDYTKGFDKQLCAFAAFLQDHPTQRGKVVFHLVTQPSRTGIKAYQDCAAKVEKLVKDINDRFGTDPWTPVIHNAEGVQHSAMAPLLRAADVIMVTPFPFDGMNLVVKEAIACNDDGAIVASCGTGAAIQMDDEGLGDALFIVDPKKSHEMAHALRKALTLDPKQKKSNMQRLQKFGAKNNVHAWAQSFMMVWNHAAKMERSDVQDTERMRKAWAAVKQEISCALPI